MTEPSAIIIPFGKHQGSTVSELIAKDPAYTQWLMSQAWLAERFAGIHAALATRGAVSDDSPDHNALQARFLNAEFRKAFLEVFDIQNYIDHVLKHWESCYGDAAMEAVQIKHHEAGQKLKKLKADLARGWFNHSPSYYNDAHYEKTWPEDALRLQREIAEQESRIVRLLNYGEQVFEIGAKQPLVVVSSSATFEQKGVDVVVYSDIKVDGPDYCATTVNPIGIELKPDMSDDFPSVMRQMQRLEARVLIVGRYAGTTVTEDQLRQMFGANGFRLIFVCEIEAKMVEGQN